MQYGKRDNPPHVCTEQSHKPLIEHAAHCVDGALTIPDEAKFIISSTDSLFADH